MTEVPIACEVHKLYETEQWHNALNDLELKWSKLITIKAFYGNTFRPFNDVVHCHYSELI